MNTTLKCIMGHGAAFRNCPIRKKMTLQAESLLLRLEAGTTWYTTFQTTTKQDGNNQAKPFHLNKKSVFLKEVFVLINSFLIIIWYVVLSCVSQ